MLGNASFHKLCIQHIKFGDGTWIRSWATNWCTIWWLYCYTLFVATVFHVHVQSLCIGHDHPLSISWAPQQQKQFWAALAIEFSVENLNNSRNPMEILKFFVPPFHTPKNDHFSREKNPMVVRGKPPPFFLVFTPPILLRLPGWSSAATNKSPGWMPARCAGPSGSRPATWGRGHHWYSWPWSGNPISLKQRDPTWTAVGIRPYPVHEIWIFKGYLQNSHTKKDAATLNWFILQ